MLSAPNAATRRHPENAAVSRRLKSAAARSSAILPSAVRRCASRVFWYRMRALASICKPSRATRSCSALSASALVGPASGVSGATLTCSPATAGCITTLLAVGQPGVKERYDGDFGGRLPIPVTPGDCGGRRAAGARCAGNGLVGFGVGCDCDAAGRAGGCSRERSSSAAPASSCASSAWPSATARRHDRQHVPIRRAATFRNSASAREAKRARVATRAFQSPQTRNVRRRSAARPRRDHSALRTRASVLAIPAQAARADRPTAVAAM
mmetsp:Transcript_3968/g.10013  ORF Transcript_3968/g.10013 Transcript_3968/m.10013 type:complete len:268 (-) Transcript_3968:101-904(-)